jgi:hypothetical protein
MEGADELLLLEKLRKWREAAMSLRARQIREPASLADVTREPQAGSAPRATYGISQGMAGIVPVFRQQSKEIQRTAGRQMNALSLVQPQNVAGKA